MSRTERVFQVDTKKAYVVPIVGHEAELEALKALIRVCSTIVCEGDPLDAFEHCVEEADVVVVLVCPEMAESDVIEEIIELANRLGKRIVGVWGAGANSANLPRGLNRHGDAMIRANAEEVAAAICADATPWITCDGIPRDPPPTPRHKKR
jgi:hypothetical protein